MMEVSVIATVLNEAGSIRQFLESMSRQQRRPQELVLCDGGSEDGTLETITAWASRAEFPVHVLHKPGVNISEGRNLAIQASSGDVVAVSDAGTVADPMWLSNLVAAIEAGADVAAGFFEPDGHGETERSIAAVTVPLLREIEPSKFLPSSRSVAFRREILEKIGNYPEWADYCEDLVLDIALKRGGARFVFVPDAIVTWSARPTMRSFARQYFRYAKGDAVAGLWTRRHFARYASYLCVLVAATYRQIPLRSSIGGVGFAALAWRHSRYVRRAFARRDFVGVALGKLAVRSVLIGLVGDVAKMAGYARGQLERAIASRCGDGRS